MDSKQILQLNRRQSIVQRIDSMKSAISAHRLKDKLGRFHYFGYPSQILVDKLIEKIPTHIDSESKIAVINDFGLEVIFKLKELGYNNLYLLCTEENDKLYSIIEYMVEKEFNFNKIVRLEENMEDKFDLVIANPPYEIGNAVITETMNHCEEAVVLMPLSCYKGKKLFTKVVDKIEIVDPKLFTDANITDNLNIAIVKSIDNRKSWQEFEFQSFDQEFIEFYQLNSNLDYIAMSIGPWVSTLTKNKQNYTPETDFFIGMRTLSNGPDKTGRSFKWNVDKNIDIKDNLFTFSKKFDKIVTAGQFIFFTSSKAKDNFTAFYYNNKLMLKLLLGLNKNDGAVNSAIPKLNWSIDRDYENIGYSELLRIMIDDQKHYIIKN